MKNLYLLLFIFPLNSLFGGWCFMDLYPWVWDAEQNAWAYYACSNNQVWAYYGGSDSWEKLEAKPESFAPDEIEDLLFRSVSDDFNYITVLRVSSASYLWVNEFARENSESYSYVKTSDNAAQLVIHEDFLINFIFSESSAGSYTAINADSNEFVGNFEESAVFSSALAGRVIVFSSENLEFFPFEYEFINGYSGEYGEPAELYKTDEFIYYSAGNEILINNDAGEIIKITLNPSEMTFTASIAGNYGEASPVYISGQYSYSE